MRFLWIGLKKLKRYYDRQRIIAKLKENCWVILDNLDQELMEL
jgi:hypothetical protein